MKYMILIGLIVFTATALPVEVNDAEWEAFKKEHKKVYNAEEDVKRRELYGNSKALVEEHNKKYEAGESTFNQGINEFSDWTEEERSKLTGKKTKRDIGLEFEWEEYKKKYNKHYEPEENTRHKELYLRRKLGIDEHNDKFDRGEVSYKQAIDNLTDLTDEEIKVHKTAERKTRASDKFEVPEGTSIDEEWELYKKHFKKTYAAEEDTKRKEIYQKNKVVIEESNAKAIAAGDSLRLGINQFADQEHHELPTGIKLPTERTKRSPKFEVPEGTSIDEEWELYKKHFKKTYSAEEDTKRKEIYQKNKASIEESNAKAIAAGDSLRLGINKFADREPHELPTGIKRTKRSPKFEVPAGATIEEEWELFKKHFKKSYDAKEDAKRIEIYKKTKSEIEAKNANLGEHDFPEGINQFADQTDEEFKSGLGLGKRTKRETGKFEVKEGATIDEEWEAFKKHFEKNL